jgi:hypothetical protein
VRAVLGTFAAIALLMALARLPLPALSDGRLVSVASGDRGDALAANTITAAAVADELTGVLAPAVGVALTALAAAVLVTLALVRRRT